MQLTNSDDLDKLYKLFGVCAHHCSNIEYNIAFLLHPAKWKKHSANLERKKRETQNELGNIKERFTAMQRFDEALDNVDQDINKLYEVPLGKLIQQIKDNYSLSDEQAEYLEEVLKKRNYVIHKIWGIYGRRLKEPLVIKEMLRELQDCEMYFRSASDWLQEQACLLNGISRDSLEANKGIT